MAIFVGHWIPKKRFVVEATATAAYAEPGYLRFYRDTGAFAQRFDLSAFALTEEPTTILTDIHIPAAG